MAQQVQMDDPNVRMPAAVRMAAERANQLHAEEYDTGEPKVEGEVEEKLVTLAEPEKPKKVDAKAPAPTVVEDAPSIVPEPKVTHVGKVVTEEAYNALKGRWDQAQAHIRTSNTRMSEMEAELAALKDQLAAYGTTRETTQERLITDQEREDFGDQFLDVAGKRAREVITPELLALRGQVAELNGKLESIAGNTKADRRQQMHDQIRAAVPNWAEINVNPEFLAWLGLPDTYSGAIRHELLKQAYDRNDATRVLAFFKGFLAEEAAVTSATDTQTDPNKVSLESLAAPGRPKTAASATPKPAASQIITRAEIAKFYTDVASGKYRGREQEQADLEAQIFRAENEGRIPL